MPGTAPVPLAPLMPGGGWCRRTKDGIWVLAHEEDDTTSWTVGHLPTRIVVKDFLGSLRQCRAYVGSGEAEADLERMLAHKRGEHKTGRDNECILCARVALSITPTIKAGLWTRLLPFDRKKAKATATAAERKEIIMTLPDFDPEDLGPVGKIRYAERLIRREHRVLDDDWLFWGHLADYLNAIAHTPELRDRRDSDWREFYRAQVMATGYIRMSRAAAGRGEAPLGIAHLRDM